MSHLAQKLDQPVELLRRELARVRVSGWEIYYEEGRELTVEVQDGDVDAYEASTGAGAGVRVQLADRTGFAFTSDFSPDAIAFTVEAAQQAARACDPDPLARLPAPGDVGPLPEVNVTDAMLFDIPKQEKIEHACQMEAAARAVSPRVTRVRKSSYAEGWGRIRLVNSEGIDQQEEGTVVHCDLLAVAEEGTDERLGWEAQSAHFFDALDFEACGRMAAARALGLLGGAPALTGRYDVVLEPQVVCEILDVLAEGLLGESVIKGRSLFAGKEGSAIVSPLITLLDDGTHPDGSATSCFDGEGMARRRTTLLERGVLKGFLYDRYWGAKAGRASTGNADRSGFRSPPMLGMSNLLIVPGEGGDAEALCGQMGEGLLIGELIGVHTADPISGDFSLGATGRQVEGGRLGAPVAGVIVAGNLLRLLAAVKAVGNDLRWYGSCGAPSLLIEGLEVAGE